MFRSLCRTATAAAVVLTLILASIPAAQASPFGSSGPSLDTRSGWFDVALSWLSNLLFGGEGAPQKELGSAFEAANTPINPGALVTPLSGSCIDPGGKPRPCDF
jgi:hypothetical protein